MYVSELHNFLGYPYALHARVSTVTKSSIMASCAKLILPKTDILVNTSMVWCHCTEESI